MKYLSVSPGVRVVVLGRVGLGRLTTAGSRESCDTGKRVYLKALRLRVCFGAESRAVQQLRSRDLPVLNGLIVGLGIGAVVSGLYRKT